jgi:MFS family permease
LTGYILAFGALMITGGRLGDIFGRERVFLVGVGGFTLASLLASMAQTGEVLVLSRGTTPLHNHSPPRLDQAPRFR